MHSRISPISTVAPPSSLSLQRRRRIRPHLTRFDARRPPFGPGGDSVLPFVLQFYGNPFVLFVGKRFWGHPRNPARRKGEQGDLLMPLLFTLGQHQALRSAQSHLLADERLLASHDNIYVVSRGERTCELCGSLARELWAHSRTRINEGKTQIWNRGGFILPGHDALLVIARQSDQEAQIWFGDRAVLASQRGIRVLGTPLGSGAFVRASKPLEYPTSCCESHCIDPRTFNRQGSFSSYALRPVRPTIFGCVIQSIPVQFANQHDAGVWQCFCSLLGQSLNAVTGEVGSLPLHMGGLGLRSACRMAHAACCGSWSDCLSTIRQRHANTARTTVEALLFPPASAIHLVRHLAEQCWPQRGSRAHVGFSSFKGYVPKPVFVEIKPGVSTHGWQFFASRVVEQRFRSEVVWPRCFPTEQALLRSLSGPMSGLPFSAVPCSSSARFPPHLFRVLLFRHLWLPLSLTRICRCGRPLDVHGHHRAACSRAGVLGGRGFSVESAAALVCREAGARVSTDVFVGDFDLPVVGHDGRAARGRCRWLATLRWCPIGDRHHARFTHPWGRC